LVERSPLPLLPYEEAVVLPRTARSTILVATLSALVVLGTAAVAWATVEVQWLMAPDTDGVVADASGHGRTLQLQGAWSADASTTDGAVLLRPWSWGLGPADPALDPTEATFAVTLRFRAPTGMAIFTTTDSPNLVQKGLGGRNAQWKVTLLRKNGGVVMCRFSGQSANVTVTSPTVNVVSDTAWHVATCVHTPTSVTVVVDGVTTTVSARTGTIASTLPVTVGNKNKTTTTDQFAGLVDGVAIATGPDAVAETLRAVG
jgi:hypothetical protein